MKCYYIIEYKPNGLIHKEYGESKREAVKNFSKRMNVEYKLVNKYSNYTHQVIEECYYGKYMFSKYSYICPK